MSHLSPHIFLLWSMLTTALGIFYFHHLWKFDRLRCLNIYRGSNNGAFKRVMTYSYLLAVPLLFAFSTGFAVIKYDEGYITLPSGLVFPKPFEQWSTNHQAALFPLNMLWGLSWVAEAISHLEELCFWLFLLHSGPSQSPWFQSVYFKLWAGGSVAATILLPVVTIATKDDPLRNEAWLQFVGATIGTFITLGFLPILWIFPSFVQHVKNEGADLEAVTRLAKFHDLNIIRIAFRFLFLIPVLLLSIDGLTPHTHTLNASMLWTDLLAMMSGVGCVVQSVITLMIFFPRNVELETQRWLLEPVKPRRVHLSKLFKKSSNDSTEISRPDKLHSKYLLTDSTIPGHSELDLHSDGQLNAYPPPPLAYENQTWQRPHSSWGDASSTVSLGQQKQRRETGGSVTGSMLSLTEANLSMHSKLAPNVNPLAMYFTSPIDLLDVPRPRRQNDEI